MCKGKIASLYVRDLFANKENIERGGKNIFASNAFFMVILTFRAIQFKCARRLKINRLGLFAGRLITSHSLFVFTTQSRREHEQDSMKQNSVFQNIKQLKDFETSKATKSLEKLLMALKADFISSCFFILSRDCVS